MDFPNGSFFINQSLAKSNISASHKLKFFQQNESWLSKNKADVDPESAVAIGQDTGLLVSMKENGFDFYIDFKDIRYNAKTDLLGSGGYGDVYKASWLGTKIALKKFRKRTLTRNALKDFIKEIEVLN